MPGNIVDKFVFLLFNTSDLSYFTTFQGAIPFVMKYDPKKKLLLILLNKRYQPIHQALCRYCADDLKE